MKFEAFEIGKKVGKEEYAEALPELRVSLLNAQFDLRKAGFSVVLLLAGDDYHGVDELIDVLHEWLDARYIDTEVFLRQTEVERERPLFFRYWRALPPEGRIGIHVGGWATGAVRAEALREGTKESRAQNLRHVRSFEQGLVEDGTLLLKVWVHLSPKEHERRGQSGKRSIAEQEEGSRWVWEQPEEALRAAEDFIEKTDTASAPWWIVEGTQDRHRNLTVARALSGALEGRLGAVNGRENSAAVAARPPPAPDFLETVDLNVRLEREEYRERLDDLQERLRKLAAEARENRVATVLVVEGGDAAGKGGCIRRITRPIEARDYRVVPIGAPNEIERAHHYLWRFWRELPARGRIVVFDRSWYGRVLVERVEGFAREDEWLRGYEEIRDFEEQIAESGAALAKFWLHIDPDEQLRRFRAREQTPYKKYKITDDDYRNRDRWDDYASAVNDMVARTSSDAAPWHVVAANDKRYARVRVLEETCNALESALEKA
ncbi:MAG: polyphosphate:AMP phosphotransferase [Myxococcota bacterium]